MKDNTAHNPDFGSLDTWIVGTQYYRSPLAPGDPVFAELEPDNPFDPNAVAVYTDAGSQAGHLPKYDAAHFSPLLKRGWIRLIGKVGDKIEPHRAALDLHVVLTPDGNAILQPNPANSPLAIFHNLFVDVWDNLSQYTAATLADFRSRMRPLAHEVGYLLPETQFLYRMLRARIAQLKHAEDLETRARLQTFLDSLHWGQPLGWPQFAVHPLFAAQPPNVPTDPLPPSAPGPSELPVPSHPTPLDESILIRRLAYPPAARGLALTVDGDLHSLFWYESADFAQAYWFMHIFQAAATRDPDSAGPPPPPTHPGEQLRHILDSMPAFDILNDVLYAQSNQHALRATLQNNAITRLHLAPIPPETPPQWEKE